MAPGMLRRLVGGRAQGGDEIRLVSDLGLDVIGEPVAVVAGEDLAAGHGKLGADGPHLLDVVVVVGVDDGRDIEVGLAQPATEVDLTEHASGLGTALLDSVEVADPRLGEGDGGLLGVADLDGLNGGETGVRGEEDISGVGVESAEGDSAGSSGGHGGDESHESLSEMHLDGSVENCFVVS